MALASLLRVLEDEISDPEEETFLLFSQPMPSQNLGFVDPKAQHLNLAVAGRDFIIHQSPSVLASNRAGGTTGAVVWKITPLFASWLASPTNPLFTTGLLTHQSTLLELGCGVSALVGLAVAPRVATYVLTDQAYVTKFVHQNLDENLSPSFSSTTSRPKKSTRGALASHRAKTGTGAGSGTSAAGRPPHSHPGAPNAPSGSSSPSNFLGTGTGTASVLFAPLDWELDVVTPALTHTSSSDSFDAVITCDCIYNDALVTPLVQTCVDVCKLRSQDRTRETVDRDEDSASNSRSESRDKGDSHPPCVCIVAQQLRNPEVFEAWLVAFHASFRVWRIPDPLLDAGLQSGSGFVVHVGILREGS